MKTLLSILFACCWCIAHAQEVFTIRNLTSSKPDSLVLCRACNNRIAVYFSKHRPYDIQLMLESDHSVLIAKDFRDTLFASVVLHHVLDEEVIVVKSVKTGQEVTRKTFKVVDIPFPEAQAGTITAKRVSKDTLIAQSGLIAVFPNSLFRKNITVARYRFSAPGIKPIAVTGNFFPQEVIEAIKKVRRNGWVEFSDIAAISREGDDFDLKKIRLTVY